MISGASLASTGKEKWAIEARHVDGRIRKMHRTFPFCRDVQEAQERLIAKATADPDFLREYKDWYFTFTPLDKALRLAQVVKPS